MCGVVPPWGRMCMLMGSLGGAQEQGKGLGEIVIEIVVEMLN